MAEGISWLPYQDFNRLHAQEKLAVRKDGYLYAKDGLVIFAWDGNAIKAFRERWDLVPRHQAADLNLSLAEMVKEKNSSYSSYNARVETVASKPTFRKPWAEGRRMVTPVDAYKERADKPDPPPEFDGKEVEIFLDGTYYMAGIHDRWRNPRGETLDSCTIITVDSLGNPKIDPWHLRIPLILHANQVPEWLDPKTTPARAMEMCKTLSADHMEIKIVIKEPSPTKAKPKGKAEGPTQISLDLG